MFLLSQFENDLLLKYNFKLSLDLYKDKSLLNLFIIAFTKHIINFSFSDFYKINNLLPEYYHFIKMLKFICDESFYNENIQLFSQLEDLLKSYKEICNC